MLTYIEVTWYNTSNHGRCALLIRSNLIDFEEKPYADRRGVPACSTHDGIQREGLGEVRDLVGR